MSDGTGARSDLTRWNRAGLDRFRYVDGNAATFLEDLRLELLARFTGPVPRDGSHPDEWWDTLEELAADPSWWRRLLAEGVPVGGDGSDPDDAERLARLRAARRWRELWVEPKPRGETLTERNARLVVQQAPGPDAGRGDPAWEVARAFARAAHVVAEHLDAHANEGFLRTATQWESVRRLATMLDVRPAPPASASTLLVLDAAGPGTVETGFAVRHTPPEGGSPVVFETLGDLAVDPALDAIRPLGWDRNPDSLQGENLVLEGALSGIALGQPVVLEDERTGRLSAYRVQGLKVGESSTTLAVRPRIAAPLTVGRTLVHVQPRDRPALLGPASGEVVLGRAVEMEEEPADLTVGDVLWLGDGTRHRFRRLVAVRGRRLVLDANVESFDTASGMVAAAQVLPVAGLGGREIGGGGGGGRVLAVRADGDHRRLVGLPVAHGRRGAAGLAVYQVFGADYHDPKDGGSLAGETVLRLSWSHGDDLTNPQRLFVPPLTGGRHALGRFLLPEAGGGLPRVLVTEEPKKAAPGEPVVLARGGQLAWARLAAVGPVPDSLREGRGEEEDASGLVIDGAWRDRGGGPYFLADTRVHTGFARTVRPVGWNRNGRPLAGTSVPVAPPGGAGLPALLVPGRRVVVQRSGSAGSARATAVAEVRVSQGRVVLRDPVPAGATFGDLVLLANVVLAGHGETQGEEPLGSGDAAQLSQSFELAATEVSFVADPTFPSGVRAAVEVRVDGRPWRQVPSFAGVEPTAPVYTVHPTEDGTLRVAFGDGRRGRRLPTGRNNARIVYRKGTGLAGNLAAGSLVKPKRPHRLVDGVAQPFPATGGADLEEAGSLRDTAPASILTLDRAVSLEDFGRLAASQASVWQARSFALPTGRGRRESVRVVVVPAGGGALSDDLRGAIERFLVTHALPGVRVVVERFRSTPVKVEVIARVRAGEADPDTVRSALEAALRAVLVLRARRLGQALAVSDLYRVVEATPGVSSSVVTLEGDRSRQGVRPEADGVVHLEAPGSALRIEVVEEVDR